MDSVAVTALAPDAPPISFRFICTETRSPGSIRPSPSDAPETSVTTVLWMRSSGGETVSVTMLAPGEISAQPAFRTAATKYGSSPFCTPESTMGQRRSDDGRNPSPARVLRHVECLGAPTGVHSIRPTGTPRPYAPHLCRDTRMGKTRAWEIHFNGSGSHVGKRV